MNFPSYDDEPKKDPEMKKKKSKRSKRLQEKRERAARARAEKREAEERERLEKWEECWDRKYQAQADREHAECCIENGYCLKPRTRSNIWINVTQDRSIQEVQMTFKHVPVPKPKPPPLPPVKVFERMMAADKTPGQKKVQKFDKKVGTLRRKRSRK